MYSKISSQAHGMVNNGSAIDCNAEQAKEDAKLRKKYVGHEVQCMGVRNDNGVKIPCREKYLLSRVEYSAEEACTLADKLRAEGCPYCQGERENVDKNSLEPESLTVNGQVFNCLRMNVFYSPKRKAIGMDQVMRRHARSMKAWVK